MTLRPRLLASACVLPVALSVRFTDNRLDDSEDKAVGPGGYASPEMSDPFNESFFTRFCDLSEYDRPAFEQPKYQLSEDEEHDNTKWEQAKKCEDTQFGLDTILLKPFQGSKYNCAQFCWQKSQEQKGHVICCGYDAPSKECSSFGSWQAMSDSSRGTSRFNPLNWIGLRTQKEARLFYTADPNATQPTDGADELEEMETTKGSQAFVKTLVEEVDTMSIDGILNHLLSFFFCMRWVPDSEFMKLASFELSHVSLDEQTPRLRPEEVDRNKVLDMYLNAQLTPLRCSNNYNVQSEADLDRLLADLRNGGSTLNEVYSFAKGVDETVGLFRRRNSINKAMLWDPEDPDSDAVQIKDLRMKARQQHLLPWSTFLRSSNMFSQQRSTPEARYMLCFGPRVASLPHKRESGAHVLADVNLAGCNGIWDQAMMIDHLERLKFLFAPAMCFEDHLRKELKGQFLNTFVRMNEEFERAMMGKFAKRLHALDPTQSKKLDLLKPHTIEFEETMTEAERKIWNKFTRNAGLLANAHSKWMICRTKDDVPREPFGSEDNFFRDPKSYQRWLGETENEHMPQCQTLDETTGCVKCIVSVKNTYGCVIRLNITQQELFIAIREHRWPWIQSGYFEQQWVNTETGRKLETVRETGACLVRKSQHTHSIAHEEDGVEGLRRAFFQVNDTDGIVRVNLDTALDSGDVLESRYRHDVHKRRTKLEEWIEGGGPGTTPTWPLPGTPGSDTEDSLQEEIYRDNKAMFPQKFIFTDQVPELSNRKAHQVDYFVSCPCSNTDFQPHGFFAEVGNKGMGDYING